MSYFTEEMIAPCGMNCGICSGFLRSENRCPGCFSGRKVNGRPIKCSRRLCKKREGKYCFECKDFPCDSIKRLDDRYRKRYGMSEIENLQMIKDRGVAKFLMEEEAKYIRGDKVFCVHDGEWKKIHGDKKPSAK